MVSGLPTYLVIGGAKCGTSSICHLLGQHPDVFMSVPKEIHYFGRNDPVKTLEWYKTFFASAEGYRAVGEGSTSYTHPDIIEACAAEIAELLPDCRLIYMVRQPLDRLESDWRMRRFEGWSHESINEAVRQQASLVTHGLYWTNLSVYRRHFSDDRILVVFLEDLSRNPQAELARCFEHIGVDPQVPLDRADQPRNTSSGFRQYGRLGDRIRRVGPAAAIKRRLPRWLVTGAKSLLGKRVRFVPEWDPVLRAEVEARFAADSRLLLQHCGKDPDYWSARTKSSSTGDVEQATGGSSST